MLLSSIAMINECIRRAAALDFCCEIFNATSICANHSLQYIDPLCCEIQSVKINPDWVDAMHCTNFVYLMWHRRTPTFHWLMEKTQNVSLRCYVRWATIVRGNRQSCCYFVAGGKDNKSMFDILFSLFLPSNIYRYHMFDVCPNYCSNTHLPIERWLTNGATNDGETWHHAIMCVMFCHIRNDGKFSCWKLTFNFHRFSKFFFPVFPERFNWKRVRV